MMQKPRSHSSQKLNKQFTRLKHAWTRVRNGFSVFSWEAYFALLFLPFGLSEENERGRTWHGYRELRMGNQFPRKRNPAGIRRNLFFSLCVTTKKSIFNHMGKIIQEPPYQKYWLEGWRLNMERHSDLLLLVKNYLPLVKTQRTRISLAQICPNLDVSHVRHDRSGQ